MLQNKYYFNSKFICNRNFNFTGSSASQQNIDLTAINIRAFTRNGNDNGKKKKLRKKKEKNPNNNKKKKPEKNAKNKDSVMKKTKNSKDIGTN